MLRDLPGVGKLTKIIFLEANGEGFDRLRHRRTHQPDHNARIDPATEKGPQGNLAHQTNFHGIFQERPCAFNRCGFIVPASWCKGQFPVTLRTDLPIFVDQDMGRRQFHNAFEEGIWCRNTAVHEVFIEGDMIHFARDASLQDGFDLRAEDQLLSIPVVIERFLPEAVAGRKQALAFPVPDGEGEHPAQVLDTLIPVLFVGVNDGLGVTIRTKVMTTLLKLFLQFTIVIDFPIQDDENALIFVKNRLMTASQVDDREAAHAQGYAIINPHSLVVWPTVATALAHTVDQLLRVVPTALYTYKSR